MNLKLGGLGRPLFILKMSCPNSGGLFPKYLSYLYMGKLTFLLPRWAFCHGSLAWSHRAPSIGKENRQIYLEDNSDLKWLLIRALHSCILLRMTNPGKEA